MQASKSTNRTCPLCGGHGYHWTEDAPTRAIREGRLRPRRYNRCPDCELVYTDGAERLTPEEERRRYLAHENDGDHYRVFLTAFVDRVLGGGDGAGVSVLDYGSGPTPALGGILRARGYRVAQWDPHFAPDPRVLTGSYQVVILHEVLEHIAAPREEFRRIGALLGPGGRLVIRTQPYPPDPEEFARWWYRADRTHLCFYRPHTVAVAAGLVGRNLVSSGEDVFIIQ